MTDSISVIGPGWRATNTSGSIITDGILAFFDAGTSNARTVYSDSSLSTSLGTTVDCNSGGYPVTSGNARTLIYTGNTAYKVRLTSVLGGGTIWEHDNVRGALDTSSFLTSAAVADQSVVNISVDRSITTADKGKLINMNCSSGALTATFADAATLGDGFFVGIRHAGTANQILITGDGTDTFAIPGASPIQFALTGLGHTVWIACDGTNFKVHSECPPLIGGTNGVIRIADRLSTPPGSPVAGARYIVGSSPTGDWSGFSEHDIAEANGSGGWFNYTPATDCGWVAYDQDSNEFLAFVTSAWVTFPISINSLTAMTDFAADADEFIVQLASGGALRKATAALVRGTLETVQATTSGTEFDFTGIPAGANRIEIRFDEVSLSGSDGLLVQIGDSGGIETTGYDSVSGNRNTEAASTSGFRTLSSSNTNGIMTLAKVNGNVWVSSHALQSGAGGTGPQNGGGRKELSGELTQVRLTRTGTNTFNGGQVNIFYQ